MSWIGELFESVPKAWRGLLVIGAILSVGASAGYTARTWGGYPSRLAKLEKDTEFLMIGFKYMTCRAVVQDEGGDPRICQRVVPGIDEFMKELMGR